MVADEQVRRWVQPALEPLAAAAARAGLRPGHLTAAGLALALGAGLAVVADAWLAAAGLWLASRLADGLDGALARRTGRASALGGLVDLSADFLAYGGFVFAVAVALPDARLACAALLLAYYLNGTVFLAVAGLAERQGRTVAEGDRSVQFVGGLAEGTETVVVHTAVALLGGLSPTWVEPVLWGFAVVVAVTVLQRLRFGLRVLRG